MIAQPNWYNLNETRNYPIDDAATGYDDSGAPLPDDLLLDAAIKFPASIGTRLCLVGATVTERLVSIVLAADLNGTLTPAAAVTLRQPATQHQLQPVEALYPGVGGFLVLGGGVSEPYAGRFTLPSQAALATTCARPYADLPVTSLRKKGLPTGLTGLVTLLGGSDVQVVKQTVPGLGDAIVVGLATTVAGYNVLSQYIGPCDVRPESRNCDRNGIETVNGVAPDCNGNLVIAFDGLTAAPYDECGVIDSGVALDQEIGLSQVCQTYVPDRFKGTDLCFEEVSSAAAVPISESSAASESLGSESSEACLTLPYNETLTSGELPPYWGTVSGTFDVDAYPQKAVSCAPGDNHIVESTNTGRRNVFILTPPCPIEANNIVAEARMLCSYRSAQKNGGLVLNYHTVDPLTNPHVEYHIVSLDMDTNRVRLLRWSGFNFAELHAAAPTQGFEPFEWYQITATIQPGSTEGSTAIAVSVTNPDKPSWPEVSFSVSTSRYLPADGYFGVGSDRSIAQFSCFSLSEATS